MKQNYFKPNLKLKKFFFNMWVFWLCDNPPTQPQTVGKFEAFNGNATSKCSDKKAWCSIVYIILQKWEKKHLKILWWSLSNGSASSDSVGQMMCWTVEFVLVVKSHKRYTTSLCKFWKQKQWYRSWVVQFSSAQTLVESDVFKRKYSLIAITKCPWNL